MAKLKQNIHAFNVANKTFRLVKNFNKQFLEELKDESLEDKLKMYSMCIQYMKETLNKRFKS